jgi:hypothetical protein
MQVVAMSRLGLSLPPDLLALAAASHSGEPFHLDAAQRILDGCGCIEDDLGNPADRPSDPFEAAGRIASGRPHAGSRTTAPASTPRCSRPPGTAAGYPPGTSTAVAGVDPDLLAPFGAVGTARGLAVAGELRDVLSTTTDKEQL